MTALFHRISLSILVLLALFALACGGALSNKLLGRWVVDWEKTAESLELPKEQTGTAPDPKAAVGMMKTLMGELTMEFQPGKLTVAVGGKRQEATWQVKSEEGNKLVITTTAQANKGKSQDIEVEFSGDTLRVGMGKQRLVLKRAKGAAADAAKPPESAKEPTTEPASETGTDAAPKVQAEPVPAAAPAGPNK